MQEIAVITDPSVLDPIRRALASGQSQDASPHFLVEALDAETPCG
jgi:hypothetical protein